MIRYVHIVGIRELSSNLLNFSSSPFFTAYCSYTDPRPRLLDALVPHRLSHLDFIVVLCLPCVLTYTVEFPLYPLRAFYSLKLQLRSVVV